MIIIPAGMHHEATMSGAVFKLVRCEVCKTEYVYRMTRTTSGTADSFLFFDTGEAREKAQRKAGDALNDVLQRDYDVVPCPSCGQIQSYMFEKARQEHTRWFNWVYIGLMLVVALDLLLLAGMGLSPNPQSSDWVFTRRVAFVVLWTCILSPILLLPVRACLRHVFEPNQEDQRARILRGRALAWLREEFEARYRVAATPPASGLVGPRLRSYANQRKDYLLYIGTPPRNPTCWSRILQIAGGNAVTEDGSTLPLCALDAFLVAYASGQLLEVSGGKGLPLPPGIRGLEVKAVERAGRVRLDDLQKGQAFVRVTFEARTQMAKRPGDYCTTLTNVGAEPVRIMKFAPCYRNGGMWVFDNCYSDEEFREWYSMGEQLWLAPGESAIDPNNIGDPPVLWAYFGETQSGVHFISGAVLSRPI